MIAEDRQRACESVERIRDDIGHNGDEAPH